MNYTKEIKEEQKYKEENFIKMQRKLTIFFSRVYNGG